MLHKVAWLQLIAEKGRLLTALAGIGFAVLLQLMQFGFRDALFDGAVVVHSNLVADLIVTSSLYESEVRPGQITRRRLYQARSVPGVAVVTPVNLGAASFKNPVTLNDKTIIVIAFAPRDSALKVPAVIQNAHLVQRPDTALFDALSRPEFGPIADLVREKGSVTTEVAGRRLKIAGLFDLGVSFAGNGHLIVSDATFQKLFNRSEGICQFGLIRLTADADLATVQSELKQRLPNDVRVLTVAEMVNVEKSYWNANTPIGFIFLLGAAVGLLVGAVIVYQILYADVSDHLGEYATLKAMGYSQRHLAMVVLEEAVILSAMGFPMGFALTLFIYRGAKASTHLPLFMTPERALLVFGLTTLTCVASALVAIRKLKAADPAEVF